MKVLRQRMRACLQARIDLTVMAETNLLDTIPKIQRNIVARVRDKERNREAAMLFGEAYFDGPREQGYGGYRYDGRWVPVANRIVEHFNLKPGDRVLDIGCAKGFLVKDLLDVCPGVEVYGFDISSYAIKECPLEVSGRLSVQDLRSPLPYADAAFDAVLCINTLHNLEMSEACVALAEIQRISDGSAFVQVDAYRNEAERQIFLDWMLTAKSFFGPEDWIKIFAKCGYSGDYYWTILECDPEEIANNQHGNLGEIE